MPQCLTLQGPLPCRCLSKPAQKTQTNPRSHTGRDGAVPLPCRLSSPLCSRHSPSAHGAASCTPPLEGPLIFPLAGTLPTTRSKLPLVLQPNGLGSSRGLVREITFSPVLCPEVPFRGRQQQGRLAPLSLLLSVRPSTSEPGKCLSQKALPTSSIPGRGWIYVLKKKITKQLIVFCTNQWTNCHIDAFILTESSLSKKALKL